MIKFVYSNEIKKTGYTIYILFYNADALKKRKELDRLI